MKLAMYLNLILCARFVMTFTEMIRLQNFCDCDEKWGLPKYLLKISIHSKGGKDCSNKFRSKHSTNTVLCLLRNLLEHSLEKKPILM